MDFKYFLFRKQRKIDAKFYTSVNLKKHNKSNVSNISSWCNYNKLLEF